MNVFRHEKDPAVYGTPQIAALYPDDPMPVNPLWKKWAERYPAIPDPEAKQVCDAFSCAWCGRCPHGEYWLCPEEDQETFKQYLKDFAAWQSRHPAFITDLYKTFTVPDGTIPGKI